MDSAWAGEQMESGEGAKNSDKSQFGARLDGMGRKRPCRAVTERPGRVDGRVSKSGGLMARFTRDG